jgi:hypothetical protein
MSASMIDLLAVFIGATTPPGNASTNSCAYGEFVAASQPDDSPYPTAQGLQEVCALAESDAG